MSFLLGSVDYLAGNIGHISMRSANSVKKVASSGDPIKQAMYNRDMGGVSLASKLLNGSASQRSRFSSECPFLGC